MLVNRVKRHGVPDPIDFTNVVAVHGRHCAHPHWTEP